MRFLTISSIICASATVFYSTFFLSKCRANDIPGIVCADNKIQDGNVVYIYRTAVPRVQNKSKNKPKRKSGPWDILWKAVVIGCAVFLCYWKCIHMLCPGGGSRRQPTNAALIASDPHAVVIQTDATREPISNSTTTNNSFGNGVVNYAFTGNRQDMVPDDGPPEYFSVVYQTSPEHNAVSPQISGTKTVETPPPAYISVAPFQ